jgi:hypothetical protein
MNGGRKRVRKESNEKEGDVNRDERKDRIRVEETVRGRVEGKNGGME